MVKIIFLLVILTLSLVTADAFAEYGTGMGRYEDNSSKSKIDSRYDDRDDLLSVKSAAYDQRDNFIQALENSKRKVSQELDKLRGKADAAGSKEKISKNESKLRAIDDHIAEARAATEENWVEVRDSIYEHYKTH